MQRPWEAGLKINRNTAAGIRRNSNRRIPCRQSIALWLRAARRSVASPWRYDFARDSTLSCSMPCLPSLLCSEAGHMPLFRFEVLEPDPAPCAQAAPRLFDTTQEAWVMFETVFEPVVFRFEADQHAGWLAVASDDDLLCFRLSKKPGQIVLDFG